MELNNNDAAVCTESIDPQTGKVSAAEINLYEELIAFAELPPEEHAQLALSPEVSSEPKADLSDNVEECPRPESLFTPAPVEPGTFVEETGRAAAEEVTENTSPEQLLPTVPIESDESGTDASETTSWSCQPDEELCSEKILTPEIIELVESHRAPEEMFATPGEEPEAASFDWVLAGSVLRSDESFTTSCATEKASDSEVANESVDTIDVQALLVKKPGLSGPLSAFNLPAEIVYTGALSRGVCVACGAESNADDLFCLSCGDFMDGTATTLPSNPTCGECKHRIDADEIFCPWCGSAIRAQR
jgi:hypothetical protein